MWHKTDNIFLRPKAHMTMLFVTPEAQLDPVHMAILCRVLAHKLQQRMYFAALAGLGWGVSSHSQGIVVSVSGYSQRQSLLMSDVLAALLSLDPEAEAERFALVKEQLLRNYRNWNFERADTHAYFAIRLLLTTNRLPVAEKLKLAEEATPTSLAGFKRRLLQRGLTRTFIHGKRVCDSVVVEGGVACERQVSLDACMLTHTRTHTRTFIHGTREEQIETSQRPHAFIRVCAHCTVHTPIPD